MIYNTDLVPILVSLGFLSAVTMWVAVRNYKNFFITFILIPLTLISSITTYRTVDNLLGYPVAAMIPEESLYVSHLETPDWIFVWVVPPGEIKPRSFVIPNTKKNQEQMQQAGKKMEQGVAQQVGMPRGTERNDGEYITYDFIIPDARELKGE